MTKYFVTTTVTFSGDVEASTPEEAEKMGWEWEDLLHYEGVYSIEVEEVEEL